MATSQNPVLARGGFDTALAAEGARMTLGGTMTKTFLLLGVFGVAMTYAWAGMPGVGLYETTVYPLLTGSFVVGVILLIGTSLRPEYASVTGPVYAAMQGLVIGIVTLILIAFALSLFGIFIPFLHEGGAIGIGFSLFVTGLAAFNLILDFDTIEQGIDRAPAAFEWYAAFGLVVTLVWLYMEMLRLLRKLRRE